MHIAAIPGLDWTQLPDEERFSLVNFYYTELCRDWHMYRQLGPEGGGLYANFDETKNPRTGLCDLSSQHMAARGHYDRYPQQALTLCKDKEHPERPQFIQCARCHRATCTDGWRPYGYGSFNELMTMTGDGSDERPYQWYCNMSAQSECVPVPKSVGALPLNPSLNLRCTYAPRH